MVRSLLSINREINETKAVIETTKDLKTRQANILLLDGLVKEKDKVIEKLEGEIHG